jgi:SAM-dependent methyltransferase
MTFLLNGLLGLCAFALVLIFFWQLVPVLFGLPWRPTELRRARRALALAALQPGEFFYDLGAGDGRVLILAAREFGARAVGVEISPLQVLAAWLAALQAHLGDRVSLKWADFNRVDLAGADVVFAYLTSGPAARLRPLLERQLKPGARVVTVSVSFEGWQPVAYDREDLLFLYRMPPEPGSLETYLLKE